MKCRADFGDGGESGGVGAGEATEGNVDALLLRLLWFAVLDQSRWYEAGGDGRIAGTIGVVFAVDGEIERVEVKNLTVDFDWVGRLHGFGFLRKLEIRFV